MPASAAEQRQGLVDLTTLARADLAALWARLDGLSAEATRDALVEVLAAIGEKYGTAAATLAADWFDDMRAEAGARGRFRAVPAVEVDVRRWESLAGWGVGPLFAAVPDRAAALALVDGGLQRTVADRHRLTMVENAVRDPEARGWTRFVSRNACDFCQMIAGRGAVFSEATADFVAHDRCLCSAAPVW